MSSVGPHHAVERVSAPFVVAAALALIAAGVLWLPSVSAQVSPDYAGPDTSRRQERSCLDSTGAVVPCAAVNPEAIGTRELRPELRDRNQRQPSDRQSEEYYRQRYGLPRREGELAPEVPYFYEPGDYNEFQEFVATSVGRRLPIFGSNLFRRVPTTFAPVDRIPVTADYVIGPGDEILIRGWGQIDIDLDRVVDRNGSIYIPQVGDVNLAGIKYQQLQPYLKTAIGRVFRNFDLNVTLGQLRSIQIFVVGQVRRPGTYTVSSLSTLVNAIFASGGPSSKGSMRRIQLKRNNKVVTEFDLYDLLLKGDKSKDAVLMPSDVIYVPSVGRLVALAGSVNVPAIYELKDDTTLGEAIHYAGGLTTTAAGQKTIVERIDNRTARTIDDFPLNDAGLARPLRDGDVVNILPLSPRFENAVTLRGNVALPGRYPWHPGMRIRDLIPNREALVTREFWKNQNLLPQEDAWVAQQAELRSSPMRAYFEEMRQRRDRLNADGYPLSDLENRAPDRYGDGSPLSGSGSARPSEPTRPQEGQEWIQNEVKRNAPDVNWDYAVLQRFSRQDLATELVPFNLGKLVLEGDETNNLVLEPGDIVTIFSQADMRIPTGKKNKFVRVEGEFKAAGVYQVGQGVTLRQVVARAGGLTPDAYLFGSVFTRESTRTQQQEKLNVFLDQMEREIERKTSTTSRNVLNPEEAATLKEKADSQRKLLQELRQVKATGRIVLAIKPNDNGLEAVPDIPLEDGDRFIVPPGTAVVNVIGAVYNESAFLYRAGRRISDYVHQAGGPTREADKSRTYVIRADGSVVSRQSASGLWSNNFGNLKLMPGDTVVVPENLSKVGFLKSLKDWSQVIGQLGLGAAAINVLK